MGGNLIRPPHDPSHRGSGQTRIVPTTLFGSPPHPTDLLKQIYFGEVAVVRAYNPAHVFRQLRTLDFAVTGDRTGGYRVTKIVHGREAQLRAFRYFLNAIQRNLLKEEAAITAIQQLLEPTPCA